MSGRGSTCEYSLSLRLLPILAVMRDIEVVSDAGSRYVIYHSMLAIVRQFYRPSEEGEEMQARRNFTAAVRALS